MPLKIIKGPPNSGRTERLRSRYVEALPRRPVLVVPSTDDIFDWERRLMRDRGAFVGARIMHFKDLVAEILELGPGGRRQVAGQLRREDLSRRAMQRSWPELERRVERQPGLVDSMLELFDELRGALISPAQFTERLRDGDGDGDFLARVVDTYGTYTDLLDEASLSDLPRLAMEAVNRPLEDWAGRPVFVAGFDDLTIQQLDLLEALAGVTEVTIAITFELGNPSMAVTEALLGELISRGGVEETPSERSAPDEHDALLFGIERGFLRKQAEASLQPTGALTIMRSSGLRAEAESVAAEIARLIDSEVAPGEIAIAVTNPSSNGTRFEDRLSEYGIEATLEGETPAPATAIGRAVLDLLRASSPGGTAAQLISFLRGPIAIDASAVDRLERSVLCEGIDSATDAAGLLGDDASRLPGWPDLTSGETDPTTAVETAVNSMLDVILSRNRSPGNEPRIRTESRIATAITRACRDLDEILGRPARSDEIARAIDGGSVKTWSVPDPENVVIASPYRMRAKRFSYLFMVSLQERGMDDPEQAGPFLSAASRSAVGMPPRKDAEDQERYLFYSCLSVPTRGLWLSSRVADESGETEFPSPYIDAVLRLLDQSDQPVRRVDRFASEVFFPAGDAPSENELARSLVGMEAGTCGDLELANGVGARIEERIDAATAADERTRTIGSLRTPAAQDVVAGLDSFGPTTLEAFTECPYRWFVEKQLRPSRFGPTPPAMARGILIHDVLERLHSESEPRMPDTDSIETWKDEAGELVDSRAEEHGLGGDSAEQLLLRTSSRLDVQRFLELEVAWQHPEKDDQEPYRFRPAHFELGFGGSSDDGVLSFDGWRLTGFIDRVDVLDGEAVIFDYKSGSSGILACKDLIEGGKLQLQLYMLAVRQSLDLTPVGSLYVPVCAGQERPRGIGLGLEPKPGRKRPRQLPGLEALKLSWTDLRLEKDLEGILEDAVNEANCAVQSIQAGEIAHGPDDCRHHFEQDCIPEAGLWERP